VSRTYLTKQNGTLDRYAGGISIVLVKQRNKKTPKFDLRLQLRLAIIPGLGIVTQ